MTRTASSESAKESTADAIRSAILRGELNPGQRLVESDLSEQFGAARAAVREALVRLEAEGLVERQHNRGARVRRVTVEEAMEIMEARAVLEGLCAARAAARATPRDRDELRKIGEGMRDAVKTGDILTYSALSEDLHVAVRELADQPTVAGVLDRLRNQSVRFHFPIALLPGYLTCGMREHLDVIDAVTSGSSDDAEQTMREHLLSVREALSQLGDRPMTGGSTRP